MTGQPDLALAVRDLRKSYGSRRALDGLDLTVPSGVVYGFLGPNGAGKTTTMRLLTGLLHSDGGTIELLGQPYTRGDRRILFDVGALVENPSFYPYLSARANLREFGSTGPPTTKARIEEVLELVGLRDRATEPVSRFSLGMKQRLGIAAALLNDPKLLLLDEPSNGLDPAGIAAMRDMLRHLASIGKTVFVSSHLLGEVRQMVDIVGIIASGKMVREGPMSELLSSESVVRVRVRREQVGRAAEVLGALLPAESGSAGAAGTSATVGEDGWLSVHVEAARSEEVARTLAQAEIYPAELHIGSDLEQLFLKLTQDSVHGDPDGSFAPVDTVRAEPRSES